MSIKSMHKNLSESSELSSILESAKDFIFKQWRTILYTTFAVLTISFCTLLYLPSKYTAISSILMDESRADLFQKQAASQDPGAQSSYIESQLEVITSKNVAKTILSNLSESTKKMMFGDSKGAIRYDAGDQIAAIQSAITARRSGLTYVINVSGTAADPVAAAELANIAVQSYLEEEVRSKFMTARNAYEWLQGRLADLREKMLSADKEVEDYKRGQTDLNRLRLLESSAKSYRDLFENFQTRLMQTAEEETYASSRARIITTASPPKARSFPRRSLFGVFALLGGISLGCCIGLFRQSQDKGLYSVDRLQEITGIRFVTSISFIGEKRLFEAPRFSLLRHIDNVRNRRFEEVLTKPKSQFSVDIRRLIYYIMDNFSESTHCSVLAVTAVEPKSGVSTLASNLALSLSAAGSRVLLLDLSVETEGRERRLSAESPHGEKDEKSLVMKYQDTASLHRAKVSFAMRDDIAHHGDALACLARSQIVESFFANARNNFDFVVCDLPDINSSADVNALSRYVDGVILAYRIGSQKLASSLHNLDTIDPERKIFIGAVLVDF